MNIQRVLCMWPLVLCALLQTNPHTNTDRKKLRAPSFTVTTNTQQNKEINTQWINVAHLMTTEPLLHADRLLNHSSVETVYYIFVCVCVCVAVACDNGGQVWGLSPFVSPSTNRSHSSWVTSHSNFTSTVQPPGFGVQLIANILTCNAFVCHFKIMGNWCGPSTSNCCMPTSWHFCCVKSRCGIKNVRFFTMKHPCFVRHSSFTRQFC